MTSTFGVPAALRYLAASSASNRPASVPGKVPAGMPEVASGSASSTTYIFPAMAMTAPPPGAPVHDQVCNRANARPATSALCAPACRTANLEQVSGNGCYRRPIGEAYLPAGWLEAVAPPGSQGWEASAVVWLLDLVPDLRGHFAVRRHPLILAVIARHTVTGTLEGARQGYRVARSELGQAVPPHAVDSALGAHRDEGRGLAAAVGGIEAVERALRGEPLQPPRRSKP
jgi:hypothetical protein